MTEQELEAKYIRIPQEIKATRRWIGYKIEQRDGKQTKVPYSAVSGSYAKSNDPSTWTSFRVAVMGCVKFGYAGIGFMLGEDANTGTNYFGIDIDNHDDNPIPQSQFDDLKDEFIDALQSYTEYSHSGKGIHIICKGHLPTGARRKAGVPIEMYEKGRFFTMTGNVINNQPINDRTSEITPLWEKYLAPKQEQAEPVPEGFKGIVFGQVQNANIVPTNIDDDTLIGKIRSSQNGYEFISLYNGDMSAYGNDHSAADMAMCKILAFWTGCDRAQMDRIFRSSALMREKWDKYRGEQTYGWMTIDKAIASQHDVYKPAAIRIRPAQAVPVEPSTEIVEYDEKGDPNITVKQIFNGEYSLDDTGNAERFYDYFGERFKYNKDNQGFMFWNGKTWSKDIKDNVRKYANKLIDVLIAEAGNTRREIEEKQKSGADDGDTEAKMMMGILKGQVDNIKRVSNKAGKDAMLSELQSLHDVPVVNSEFDTQPSLLNTDSGVVDLETGEIKPFDKSYMLSKNTNCKVSFEEPKVWLKFLHDIFRRDNEKETDELIDVIQMALGESLTGRTNKEHLFILYGNGSNGKSTFVKVVNDVFGDYGTSMNSDMLIQSNNSSQSNEFSLSALLGSRMVTTSETAEGKRLDEVTIKRMLSGEKINAQFKYGQPFSFMPTFSPWMSTNNKPIIRATDFGTWRRIFYVPFLNTFTDANKDVNMPAKLAAENPQILGWMIQGAVKLHAQFGDKLPKPKCLEEALSDYKKELDVVVAFISARCIDFPEMDIEASALYQNYKEWAKDNGEFCYSESRFKLELPKKGYKLRKDPNRGWVYCGLKLANDRRGIAFGEDVYAESK